MPKQEGRTVVTTGPPDVAAEQALAVQRIVQTFALGAMALVGILLPLTFIEGVGVGMPDGVRTIAGLGLMLGHGLAARAPWAQLIQTRRGRNLLDLYPFALLASMAPLPIMHGGNQPVFWGVALLLGFAALFTSRAMFVTLMTITAAMHVGTFLRFGGDPDLIGTLSALGSTLLLAVLMRLAGRRFQDAVRELSHRQVLQAQTIEELTELDRLKGDFLSTVSHEIRTPITVILGMAETVDERWEGLDDDDRLELLRRLRRNASGLETVISNLLDFAKLDRGHVEASPEVVDVGALCREVVSRLETLLRDHEVDLHTDAGAVAMADGALIERVVENLVVNATRHTPPGTHIAVTVMRDSDRIAVSVADDGPGIADADLRRLGERFYRGGDATTRPSRGVGLGLAFCKQILQLHDTDLQVASTLGVGTTFSFDLAVAVLAGEQTVA